MLWRWDRQTGALERSVVLALICATVVSLAALPLAYTMERGEVAGRQLLNVVTLTTIAVPGIVLAAGYIFAWNQPWQAHHGFQFYGTIELLVVAMIAGALPYAVRLYAGSLAQVNSTMIDASRVQGAGIWTTLIVFPMLRAQVQSIWMLVLQAPCLSLRLPSFSTRRANQPCQLKFWRFSATSGPAQPWLSHFCPLRPSLESCSRRVLCWLAEVTFWNRSRAVRISPGLARRNAGLPNA
jgi:ABC-type spermidine/putrescine transport system permease subunit II